jgi:hypothetical protein
MKRKKKKHKKVDDEPVGKFKQYMYILLDFKDLMNIVGL